MSYEYFSLNGKLRPIAEAVISLSCVEYAYGFGVYETIRVVRGKPRYIKDHVARLMESARIIGIEHAFTPENIETSITGLIAKNAAEACNLKLLLIGGSTAEAAALSIQCLNPSYPDKKLYRDGITVISHEYERLYPHAKSLNMLESYRAYKKAKEAGSYDALLINRKGFITEGTRTNFFCIKGKVIYSPAEEEILLGVTRDHVLAVAKRYGYSVETNDIGLADIVSYDGAFLTSTSSKIMPIRAIDDKPLTPVPDTLRVLMSAYDDFLDSEGL